MVNTEPYKIHNGNPIQQYGIKAICSKWNNNSYPHR